MNLKVNKLFLKGFRGVKEMELSLDENLTVLAGKNGAGKSSILDALFICLSTFTSRMASVQGKGKQITLLDIRNQAPHAELEIVLNVKEMVQQVRWKVAKARKRTPSVKSDLSSVNELRNVLIHSLQNSVLVFVQYPVTRSVLDIPLRIRGRHEYDPFDQLSLASVSGVNFRTFFEWFRDREDFENEQKVSNGKGLKYNDPQLKAVRKAIEVFTGFKGVSVRRKPLRMEVKKGGQVLQIDQLSMGEKCLLALVGDLARRLAIANPRMEDCLKGAGIVLIDEIDLHLHPSLQSTIVNSLREIFPNIQFVLTTHSPHVVGACNPSQVRLLDDADTEQGITQYQPQVSKGLSANEVLSMLMNAEYQDATMKQKLDQVYLDIDKGDLSKAEQSISELRQAFGELPEFKKVDTLVSFLKS